MDYHLVRGPVNLATGLFCFRVKDKLHVRDILMLFTAR